MHANPSVWRAPPTRPRAVAPPCWRSRYNALAAPPHLAPLLDVNPAAATYTPFVWFNDFWLLRDYLVGPQGWGDASRCCTRAAHQGAARRALVALQPCWHPPGRVALHRRCP